MAAPASKLMGGVVTKKNDQRWREEMGRFAAVMSVVLIWTQIADAKWELWGNWTGADLKEVCEQADPNDTLSGCLAYVLGTLDGIGLMKGNNGNAIKVCEVPHHVTSMQWILSIREYFDKHPTELGEQGAVLVPRIVNSAFPCP